MLHKWTKKSERLYPSALFEFIDLGERLEKKLKDVNCSIVSINNIKEMIIFLKTKIKNPKRYTKIIKL